MDERDWPAVESRLHELYVLFLVFKMYVHFTFRVYFIVNDRIYIFRKSLSAVHLRCTTPYPCMGGHLLVNHRECFLLQVQSKYNWIMVWMLFWLYLEYWRSRHEFKSAKNRLISVHWQGIFPGRDLTRLFSWYIQKNIKSSTKSWCILWRWTIKFRFNR